MKKIRNIAVFTSIRSEYGVLLPILKKIELDSQFNLELLVGGAHLLLEHGKTINEILNDGFSISHKFPFLYTDSEVSANIRSMALLQLQMGDYLIASKPDLLLVVGDRFELLSVVTAALMLGVPIAHISGGDVTEGTIDNQIRHAISKMSHIHFTGTENSRNNLLRMGEEDWRVINTGEPGIDCILEITTLKKDDLYLELGLDLSKKTVISTFHPETISNKIDSDFIKKLFNNLFVEFPDYQFLVTSSNFDSGGNEINETFIELAINNKNLVFIKSLGQKKYYSILEYADFMLGNSSSGIIEAQSFDLAVVNIGNRQKGRERNLNTIDVEVSINKIIEASLLATNYEFKDKFKFKENLYGNGNCSTKIIEFFKDLDYSKLLLKKNTFN